ncbi:WD40 repeat-like protein, partial [Myriangium duriaei CBS 260.36]
LDRLLPVQEAVFDSYAESHSALCLENTRTELLQRIYEWTLDPDGKCIYWLSGMAGTGKSTISRTVARRLDENGQLAATFFLKRGEGARSDAKRLFPTLAGQLALRMPGVAASIVEALKGDPSLASKALRQQFSKLINDPICALQQIQPGGQPFIVIIDALDECDNTTDVRTIIKLFDHFHHSGLFRLRVLVTSRPEVPMQEEFRRLSSSIYHDVILQDVTQSSIEHDITLFYHAELRTWSTGLASTRPDLRLPPDWPSDGELRALVQLTVPLFISASTACRYIKEYRRGLPDDRLKTLLSQKHQSRATLLESTYKPVIDQVISGFDDDDRAEVQVDYHKVIGTIMSAFEPVSILSISEIHRIGQHDIVLILESLHSVLDVPNDSWKPIRPFHLSLHDYLVSPLQRDKWFWIDESNAHKILASRCIELLSSPTALRRDLCDVESPGTLRSDVNSSVVGQKIPAYVAYACRFWIPHLQKSGRSIHHNDKVHQFLVTNFLFWVEALCWLGSIGDGLIMLQTLLSLVHKDFTELWNFLSDACRFLRHNCAVLNVSPLQIYSSCLIFAPQDSIIKAMFICQISEDFIVHATVGATWGPELQKLEGNDQAASCVAFSPDGKTLAAGLIDGTIRTWNVTTGLRCQTLGATLDQADEYDRLEIIFSPNGSQLVSSSLDKKIRFWDLSTGLVVMQLDGDGDTQANPSIAFSRDGKMLALALAQGRKVRKIHLYDTSTGFHLRTFTLKDRFLLSFAFSPENKLLTFSMTEFALSLYDASTDNEIRELKDCGSTLNWSIFSPDADMIATICRLSVISIWHIQTGGVLRIERHTPPIGSIQFSPNSKMLASASKDFSVRLWDTSTGRSLGKIKGHASSITSLAFGPDGEMLASASEDGTVHLWDLSILSKRANFRQHEPQHADISSIAISCNGDMLAIASRDGLALIWHISSGVMLRKLSHTPAVSACGFAHDDRILVTASFDFYIRLWDVTLG